MRTDLTRHGIPDVSTPNGPCLGPDIDTHNYGFNNLWVWNRIPDPNAVNTSRSSCELPHPARADALAEGGASCFHDVVRLRLTAHQTLSGERALQEQPQFP